MKPYIYVPLPTFVPLCFETFHRFANLESANPTPNPLSNPPRYGFAQELDQTYGERLEEFADELIAEADARTRRAEPTVRISAPAPARFREDLRGKKVDRGGDFLSWRKQELPVGARPANPGDTI